MFGIEKDDDQDPKAQVLQEILDYAREKMMEGAKGKEMPEGEMAIEISSDKMPESSEGMDAEDAMEGGSEPKACPHCGKPC